MSTNCARVLASSKALEVIPRDTKLGQISGVVDDGVHVFRGVPYAAPPTGEKKWKPPQPIQPWEGVRDANIWCRVSHGQFQNLDYGQVRPSC